ncbi:MAG: hypothetical protein Q8O67_17760 [Deltaproteobacteria bacterium]|nr:hypothetical protein [Deltaproteobacteria bacterium]
MNTITAFLVLSALASNKPTPSLDRAADQLTPPPSFADEPAPPTTTTTTTPAVAAPPPAPVVAAPPVRAIAEDKKVLRIAVYELEASGVDPKVARLVTDSVVSELRKLQRVSVVSMDEVRAMLDLETKKQITGCSEASCLSEIADSLGVDGVVIGTLASVEGAHVFGMRRIDQREAKTLGVVNQRLEGANGEEYLACVGPAVAELFPEFPLRTGQTRGVAAEVALRINPPPLPTWVFWSAVATSGALVAGGITAGVLNGVERASLDAYVATAGQEPLEGSVFVEKNNSIVNTAGVAWALVGGAVVAGAATSVVSLFTDWNNYGAEAALSVQ